MSFRGAKDTASASRTEDTEDSQKMPVSGTRQSSGLSPLKLLLLITVLLGGLVFLDFRQTPSRDDPSGTEVLGTEVLGTESELEPEPEACKCSALKVMNINTMNYMGSWKKRFTGMAQVIERAQPDIVALEEIRRDEYKDSGKTQLDFLADLLPDYNYHHYEMGMQYGSDEEGLGLLSRLPFTNFSVTKLSYQVTDDDKNTRIAMHAFFPDVGCRCVNPEAPSPGLHVFVSHLSYEPQVATRQAGDFSKVVDGIVGKNAAFIAMGDFNVYGTGPDSSIWQTLTGRAKGGMCALDAWPGSGHTVWNRNSSTFSTWFPVNRADLVLYRSAEAPRKTAAPLLQLKPVRAYIHRTDTRGVPFAKDDKPASPALCKDAKIDMKELQVVSREDSLSDHAPLEVTFDVRAVEPGSVAVPSCVAQAQAQYAAIEASMPAEGYTKQHQKDDATGTYNYLIVASAPMAQLWWKEHSQWFLDNDYKIIALNNAWSIPYPHVDHWFHASDFSGAGTLFPKEEHWPCIQDEVVTTCQTHKYRSARTCVALLDTLHMIMDWHRSPKHTLNVVVVGSDMVYKGDTHFYTSHGTLDPLRQGSGWLKGELSHLLEQFKARGKATISNAGPKRETLLPFPWFNGHLHT
ncbi:hypothetical protein CYMTET_24451 [Cymbomonas tetramitiformis]|uniref:Endonuclease/exonuclease/phosphatase domain-containing protein n=1 Tax=Cymbomonas tetramitiformis TaxID=36881 RepID=A0AAE0FVU6_9CHLO|nr:hypothetical protein CYMTET_24451 [Cymbomonas tetramitiformis]